MIFWNYWLPSLLYSRSVALYGSGHPDFNIFYNAGWLWMHGQNPYLLDQFVYPPPSIPFFAFYALIPIEQAAQAWMATYLTVFLAAMLALAISLKRERRSLFLTIAPILFVTSFPLLIMVVLGQSDLFVSSLCMLSFAALRFKRDTASAASLSLGVLMKGTPVFLLIYFVLYRRDISYLLRFIAIVSGIVLTSLLVIPTQLYYSYFTVVGPEMAVAASAEQNQSITGLVTMLGMSNISTVVALAGIAALSVFAFYANRKTSNNSREVTLNADAMFLMNILVMLALGPRSWPANYVWVILPVALFLSGLLTEHVNTLYLVAVGAAAFLLNASLTQEFLNLTTLPLALSGNLILIMLLIPKCIRPPLPQTRDR